MPNQDNTPILFWVISVFALLWNLFGAFQCWTEYQLWSNPDTIASLGENADAFAKIYDATPGWVFIVFAAAVLTGVLGAVALLMKKSSAVSLFLISTIATIIHFGYYLFGTDSVALMGPSTYALPTVIIGLDIFFWFYAKKSKDQKILA